MHIIDGSPAPLKPGTATARKQRRNDYVRLAPALRSIYETLLPHVLAMGARARSDAVAADIAMHLSEALDHLLDAELLCERRGARR